MNSRHRIVIFCQRILSSSPILEFLQHGPEELEERQEDSNQCGNQSATLQQRSKPTIIWHGSESACLIEVSQSLFNVKASKPLPRVEACQPLPRVEASQPLLKVEAS